MVATKPDERVTRDAFMLSQFHYALPDADDSLALLYACLLAANRASDYFPDMVTEHAAFTIRAASLLARKGQGQLL